MREISDARAYHLLEAFSAAIADALLEDFPVSAVRVRVRKPDVVLDPPVEFAAVVGRTPRGRHDRRYETRRRYVASRTPFVGTTARNAKRPGPLLVNVRRSVVPGLIAAREPVRPGDPLRDADRCLLPEAEIEVRIGRQRRREPAVLREPDAVDVTGVLDRRRAAPGRSCARLAGVVSGGTEVS